MRAGTYKPGRIVFFVSNIAVSICYFIPFFLPLCRKHPDQQMNERNNILFLQKIISIILSTIVSAVSFTGNCASPANDTSILEVADSISPLRTHEFYRFQPKQLIAPGVLLAGGITGIYAFHGFRNSVRDHFSHNHPTHVDDYLQYAPAAAYLTVGFIPGVKHRGDFRDRLMAGVSAYAVMTIVNNVMKLSFREKRPDSGARNSFPSGHSATAFTGAELMRIEYGNIVGIAGYAVAVSIGALRIYNGRHWINDVLGGAAIGILSARIGYWLVPFERRLFGLDKQKLKHGQSMALLPTYGHDSGFGMAMAITF